jgi:microcin C transport system substrate-binding protein
VCLFDQLKYSARFNQFDYANASATRGGRVRQAVVGTFNNFNMVIVGVKGDLVEGIERIYDPLMVSSLDEAASVYGLVAEARYPDDFSWVSFRFGEYSRIKSYFGGTELASSGLPQGRELELLRYVRSEVPPEVFTTPYWNPPTPNDQAERANLLEAIDLLSQAGFEIKDLVLVDPSIGEQMTIEFLIGDKNLERVILFYQPALERIAMKVSVCLVDDIQYTNRLHQWDFDIVVANWPESLTPGNEQRDYWGSHAAKLHGSRNLIGIKDPAVDALIERIVFADTRDELVAATRALDRVLLWNHFVVPQWTLFNERTARWDRFGCPAHMPKYGLAAFPTLWWWEGERRSTSREVRARHE